MNTAGLFAKVKARTGKGRHAGAVVAAIFQPSQPLDQDGFRFLAAGVADDSTHAGSSMNGVP